LTMPMPTPPTIIPGMRWVQAEPASSPRMSSNPAPMTIRPGPMSSRPAPARGHQAITSHDCRR
jgi:hypothetical protein